MKRSPESVQDKLREKYGVSLTEARFCWEWHNALVTGRDTPSQGQIWLKVSASKTIESARSAAARALAKDNVKAALAFLEIPREKKVKDRRAKALKRWLDHATSDIGDYLEVREFSPDRSELLKLFESVPSDKDLFIRLREMLTGVRLKDWSKLTKSQRQNVQSVEQTKDGAIKFKLEPKAPWEKLMQDAHGWKAAIVVEVNTMVTDALKELADGIDTYRPDIKEGFEEVLERMAAKK